MPIPIAYNQSELQGPGTFTKIEEGAVPEKVVEELPIVEERKGEMYVPANKEDIRPITVSEEIVPAPTEDVEQVGPNEFVVAATRDAFEVGIKVRTRGIRPSKSTDDFTKELMNSIKGAYEQIQEAFVFKDVEILKIFLTSWLMPEGSIILWGIPGTGKTTLIEATTMAMCNDVDFISGKYKPDVVEKFQKSKHGNLGIASYNPAKMPVDIFYRTKIEIEEMREQLEIPEQEIMLNPTYSVRNPLERTGLQRYRIEPSPREIITAPVKFHNEFNRSSPVNQDAMLRLLSEKEMEYMGKVFRSPPAINIFDGNRYVMMEEGRLVDKALLDRIDLSVSVPNIPPEERMDLLGKIFGVENSSIRPLYTIINAINEGRMIPLTRGELYTLWKMIDDIPMDQKAIDFAVVALSFFSVGYRYFDGGNLKQSMEEQKRVIEDVLGIGDLEVKEPLDLSDVLFTRAYKIQPKYIKEGAEDKPTPLEFIDMLKTQVGHRAYNSLIRALKAYSFLEACIDGNPLPRMFKPAKETVAKLIKYVISHRLGFNPDPLISSNITSYEIIIDQIYKHHIFNTRSGMWSKIIDISHMVLANKLPLEDSMKAFDSKVEDEVYQGRVTEYESDLQTMPDIRILREMHYTRSKRLAEGKASVITIA